MNKPREAEDARRLRRLREQAAAWYIEQPLDERRYAAFLEWLRSSPRHVSEYLAIARMHGDLEAAASLDTLPLDELLEQARREPAVVPLRGEASPPHVVTSPAVPHRRRASYRAVGWAAAGLLALTAAWGLVDRWNPAGSGRVAGGQDYAAGSDGVRSFELSDGTRVQLNRDSAIRVNYDDRLRRIAVLRGDALFDVGKDPQRPLLVSVGGHVLQDVGTVFEVQRAANDDILTVISGRVRVWDRAATAALERAPAALPGAALADLAGGEQICLVGGAVSDVRQVAPAQATAWLPDDIRFERATVAEVARRFNAYTATPLVVEDPRIAGLRISGVFHARNPQAFLAYLASLPDVAVQQEGSRVRIVARQAASAPARL